MHVEGFVRKTLCLGVNLMLYIRLKSALWTLFLKLHKLGIIRPRARLDSQSSHLSPASEASSVLRRRTWLFKGVMEKATQACRAHMPPVGSDVTQIHLCNRLEFSYPGVSMFLPLNSAQSHPGCPFHFAGWLITHSSTMCRPWPCSAACLKPSPGYRGAQTPTAPFLSVPPPCPPTADTYDRSFFPVCLDCLRTSLG